MSTQEFGVNIQILGAPDRDCALLRRGSGDTHSLFWLRDGRLSTAVSVGAPRDMIVARPLAVSGQAVPVGVLGDPAADPRKLLRPKA